MLVHVWPGYAGLREDRPGYSVLNQAWNGYIRLGHDSPGKIRVVQDSLYYVRLDSLVHVTCYVRLGQVMRG
jgi:hypothetical protein